MSTPVRNIHENEPMKNRLVADLPAVHLIDVPTTGMSGLQASATVRLPRAVQLPAAVGLPRVVATEADPQDMSLVLQSLVGTPFIRRSRPFSSGIKALLVICVMGALLAFIFVFAFAQHQIDLASLWRASPIDTQALPPVALREAAPLPVEPRPISAPTAETRPAASEGLAVRAGPDSEVQTQPVGITTRSDTMPNAVKATAKASPLTPATREAQTGVWTYCVVNLIPSGQIAVQKAMAYRACISAGKKCAGPRRYADIQFFDRATLTSKVPLELCYKES